MAEQQATARFLMQDDAIDEYLNHYRSELSARLNSFYDGFVALREQDYAVDVIAPQAAIYLTIKIDLAGKAHEGTVLQTQEDVTGFLLDVAQIAVVPFYAFGASRQSPWYRLSIGTCHKEDIPKVLAGLEAALAHLS